MKKILSLAMAIVMMMAIAVPAFAAVEYEDGTAGSTTKIETLTVTEDNEDPTWYTVTIPGSQTIFWEATATEIEYSIASQLATGDLVKVTVTGSGKMSNGAATLDYAIADAEYEATAEVCDETDKVTIDTSMADWTTVPVDAYSDTLTFTAEIV